MINKLSFELHKSRFKSTCMSLVKFFDLSQFIFLMCKMGIWRFNKTYKIVSMVPGLFLL